MIIKSSIPGWFGFGAVTVWPFVLIKNPDDTALIAHELVHYREQAWVLPIWALRYWLSKSFRQGAEVRAYKVQVAVGFDVNQAAWLLANKYRLNLTQDEARILLTM